ncbi:hypothetical protein PCANC_24954 [Puccinia coronata f. sp. avenae]|uniref:Uncharacterized protein n=1 Tax=Puccinia coronata f. sp. avenae TaxID=200324 RepID=A0A2N5S8R5_9BASI|nr:hypothetical protein PCANC_24954 [Puccinia coronata f. sp. avenae]
MDHFSDSTFIGPIDTRVPLERRVAQLSKQLSSIQINNSDQRTDLDSLFDELNKIKSSFDNLANNIKDINSMKMLYTDFCQLKISFNNKLGRLQHSINSTREPPAVAAAGSLGSGTEHLLDTEQMRENRCRMNFKSSLAATGSLGPGSEHLLEM